MKRTLYLLALAFALTGCAVIPEASGNIHPKVLSQPVDPQVVGGTIIHDSTAQGPTSISLDENIAGQEVTLILVCVQRTQDVHITTEGLTAEQTSPEECNESFDNPIIFQADSTLETGQGFEIEIDVPEGVSYRIIVGSEP